MGSFANGVFTMLLGWVSGVARFVWNLFSSEGGGGLWQWIGKHWIPLVGILCGIGLVFDLVVYVFRWEPFRVWRTPWSRRAREKQMNREAEKAERQAQIREQRWNDPASETIIRESERQPELSRWETQIEIEEPAPQEPDLVTPAGYRVPADSPYRPPAREREEGGRMRGVAPVTRRRRRLNVATLLSDAEEDLTAYQKPETIIDRHQAYHEPVYPRRWRNNEDEDDR